MEKFENEYRQMIQEDMPDLWKRIEAGLKEKDLKKEAVAGTEKREEGRRRQEEQPWEIHEKYKRSPVAGWRRYAVTVAAGVCVLLMIPAVLFSVSLRSGKGGNSSSTAPAEMDSAACDTATQTASESGGVEDMAWENMEPGAGEETAESTEGEIHAAAAGGTGNENTEGTAEGVYIEDGTVIEKVRIRVLETTDMQYHTVYRVAVEQDESGLLTEGAELRVLSDHSAELKEGAEYRISILYSGEASVPFRLVDWEEGGQSG